MLNFFNRVIATGFYIGYIPLAPGTAGSIFALLLLIIFPVFQQPWFLLILILTGLIVAGFEEKITGINDDPRVVIDEICGIMVTFLGIKYNWWLLITGFVLFRIFDIYKPYPVNQSQKLPGGWGVMVDDILAGLEAHILLRIIISLY